MAGWCLVKSESDKFKKALKDGTIDPVKLMLMTSHERNIFFSKIVDPENAMRVNALFESKLILKNQKAGMISWAKKVAGLSKQAKTDLVTKIEKLDKVLNPEDEKKFLHDLASEKLGADVTPEEAKNVAKLAKEVNDNFTAYDPKLETWTSQETKLKYGASRVALENYVNDLKAGDQSIVGDIKSFASETKQAIKEYPLKGVAQAIGKTIEFIANNSVSLVATLDDSFLGRQGLHTLFTHPTKWAIGATQSIKGLVGTLGGRNMTDAFFAHIYSQPNYINGEYKLAKLIPKNEEQFPGTILEKIPLAGRLLKSADVAFSTSGIAMRTALYDFLKEQAVKSGVEFDTKQIKDLGTLINALTARGSFGEREQLGVVRLVLWAPKMLKGNYDVLTGHSLGVGLKTPFARKQAAINWVKIIAISSAIIGLSNALKKGSAETDPTSTDFGKIKIGQTRIDYSGGAGSLITLAARLLTGHYKSATTGKIVDYGSKYGQTSRFDAVIQFITGKENPPASVITDFLKGTNFQGKPPTLSDELYRAFTPISLQNIIGLKDNKSADYILGIITDFIGLSSNSYQDSNIKSNIIPENTRMSNQTFIGSVLLYAKAMGEDPETAFNRIFTGQRIKRVTNGTIVVERMPLAGSQAIKKKAGANNPTMKLDHIIPLEIGGSNNSGNLKLVTTSEWSSYTPVENALGKALIAGKITKQQAQSLIQKFKSISNSTQRKKYGMTIISKYK